MIYSGIVVTFAARSLWIAAYERIGAASSGGLSYLETLLSILLPLIILGERLSVELIVGAVLIMYGVYMTQSRITKSNCMSERNGSHILPYRH